MKTQRFGFLVFCGLCAVFMACVLNFRHILDRPQVSSFLHIAIGTKEQSLATDSTFSWYHKGPQSMYTTGVLAFSPNDTLEGCIVDFRIRGPMDNTSNRIFFFDSLGQVDHVQSMTNDGSVLNPQIAYGIDGSVFTSLTNYDRSMDYVTPCIRKYNKKGQVDWEFGQNGVPPGSVITNSLSKPYKHLWGKSYDFSTTKVVGLWTDRKNRLYILTEDYSLHIYSDKAKPIAIFYLTTSNNVHLQNSKNKIDSTFLSFIDSKGRIYGGKAALNADGQVMHYELVVWDWENGVKEVSSFREPEFGHVVGVDKQENIYFSDSNNERIYRLGTQKKTAIIFEPQNFYRKWIQAERDIWLNQQNSKVNSYAQAQWKADKGSNIGPRVGHVAYVDNSGNLYIALVGANEFRIDKISFQ